MRSISFLFLTLALCTILGKVYKLSDESYEYFNKNKGPLLIKFFTPWCTHCKKFAPIFEEAANKVLERGPKVVFAEINVDENRKTQNDFLVSSFPTVVFVNGNQRIVYKGDRTVQGIIDFLDRQFAVSLPAISTKEELENFKKIKAFKSILISDDIEILKEFEKTSKEEPAYKFYQMSQEFGKAAFPNVTQTPTIILYSDTEEEGVHFAPNFSVEEFEDFLVANEDPLVVTDLNRGIVDKIFPLNKATHKGIFLLRSAFDLGADNMDKEFRKVAKKMKFDKYIFAISDITGEGFPKKIGNFLGLSEKDLPTIQIIDVGKEMKRYAYNGSMNEEAIYKFLKSWEIGDAVRYLKSEPIPTENKGPVYKVVGKNFADEVINNKMDVVVNFCTPWSHPCREFEPIYEEIAKKLQKNEKLKFTTIDMNANDVAGHSPIHFPALKLFPARNKESVKEYTDNFDTKDIIYFLKNVCSYPVEESS